MPSQRLGGPIPRDIAILSLRYPISSDAHAGRLVLAPKMVPYSLLALSFTQACLCDPPFATYRAIIVGYPIKRSTKQFAILSLQVSGDMKSIAAGPLSSKTGTLPDRCEAAHCIACNVSPDWVKHQ